MRPHTKPCEKFRLIGQPLKLLKVGPVQRSLWNGVIGADVYPERLRPVQVQRACRTMRVPADDSNHLVECRSQQVTHRPVAEVSAKKYADVRITSLERLGARRHPEQRFK